jgi:hypothetical protein
MLYTAWLGGKLVQELGGAVKPVMEQQEKQEGQKEKAQPQVTEQRHDGHGRSRAPQSAGSRH